MNWRLILVIAVLIVAAGCGPKIVPHAFSFDAGDDSPGEEILDYRYGESKQPGARPYEGRSAAQRTNIIGAIRVGDELYVKWMVRRTEQIYEDTVDLRKRLPKDITDHRIHFVVKGSQLYVYLITPERLLKGERNPTGYTGVYSYRKTLQLYPD